MKRSFRLSDSAPDVKRDVSDELRFHLEMRTQEFVEQGMSPADARRAALATFGDPEAVEAECRAVRATRERRRTRGEMLQGVASDAHYALRALRRSPGFAIAAILTFALGIGAAAAVFTVVNGVLLRPMPYAAPERLAMHWTTGDGGAIAQWPHSAASFEDVRVRTRAFAAMAAFRFWPYTLEEQGETEMLAGARVTPALFGLLGARPILGRALSADDAVPGAARVTVLSYDLWRRRYGGAADVVGRAITLSGERFTVVGVMPRGFSFPRGAELPAGFTFRPRTELWSPLAFTERDLAERGTLNLAVVGRLRDGVDFAAANADADRLAAGFRREYPRNFPASMGLRVVSLKEQATEPVRRGLLLFMGAVALVLLVACANVTNLLLARAAARAREFAVRRALGATAGRLASQLVVENVVLALLGAIVGLLFAAWASAAAVAVVPGDLPRADDVHVDLAVVLATLGAALLAGVLFGLAGAAGATRAGSIESLREGRSSGSVARRAGRRLLVAVEVALSLVLLVGAALLATSFARLQRVDAGFRPDGALTAGLLMPIAGGIDFARDGPRWARQHAEYAERVARLPHVAAVGGVSSLPLSGATEGTTFTVEGEPPPPADRRPRADYSVVTPGWFAAMGMPIVAGRTFDARDRADGVPSVIVSEGLVRRHFPDGQAIGRRLLGGLDGGGRVIVGVVGDVRLTALDAPSAPAVYYPVAQVPYPYLTYVARSRTGDPATLLPALRRELAAMDPGLALHDVRTLASVVQASLARQRFGMMVAGGFAVAALLLASVGLYGVIAYGVTQRTREIGVRVALGAQPADVRRLVVGEGLRTALLGTVVGLVGAAAGARAIRAQLFEVSPAAPAVYAAAAALAMGVAFLASWLPARRAARVDPAVTLRAE